jgi:maltose phosphorylase
VFQRENFRRAEHERRLVPSFFEATLNNGTEIAVSIRRFLSIVLDEGSYQLRNYVFEQGLKIVYKPYIDAGVSNEDANWEEKFGNLLLKKSGNEVTAQTFKTHFKVTTFMHNSILTNGENKYFAIQY